MLKMKQHFRSRHQLLAHIIWVEWLLHQKSTFQWRLCSKSFIGFSAGFDFSKNEDLFIF